MHRQRGQALVFIAVTAVIVLLATLATFNVGQLSYHRVKLQNTADAAVYSAAVSHARELNFSAYMNRGVIANQVQVAQLVSLVGWARNFENTYNGEMTWISELFAPMSSLGAMWTTPFNAYKTLSSGLKTALENAAKIAMPALENVLIPALGGASQIYHYAMGPSILLQTVPDVIEANEPQASLSTLGYAALGISVARQETFTTSVSPSGNTDGDDRMGKVTQASTDYFYKNRSLPVPIWPTPILIDPTRLFTYGFGPLLMMQFHSGGSSLKSSSGADHLQGWTSLDATGIFIVLCVTIPVFGIPVPIPIPLPPLPAGRGAAGAGNNNWMSANGLQPFSNNLEHRNAANNAQDGWAAVQFGAAHVNPMTAIPAWWKTGEGPGDNMSTASGIRSYMEVAANRSGRTSNQATKSGNTSQHLNNIAPAWIIEIERGSNTLLTSSSGGYTIGGTSGNGQLNLPLANTNIKAIARAEAYFSRPKNLFPRAIDSKTEWGSTYSPYWQARLAPEGLLEQSASMLGTALFGP